MFKKLVYLRERGISLRHLNIAMFAIAIIISVILFYEMHETSTIYKRTHKVTQTQIVLEESAEDVRVASDYLTEQMRRFVITGDREYLDNYFTEAFVTKRREKALGTMEKHQENRDAINNIRNATEGSNELMDTEYYAARLTVEAYGYDVSEYPEEIKNVTISEGDLKLSADEMKAYAVQLLFNDAYSKKKDQIMSNMDSCIDELKNELKEEQNIAAEQMSHQVFVEHTLTVVLIAIMLGIVIMTSRLIIAPIINAIFLIRDERDIPIEGAYEVRFLAKTYNLMFNNHQQSREKLTYEATHDKLTGLYNRRGYDFLIKNVDMETSTLIIIDLDNFKNVNDSYGHDIGDKVLAKAADIIYNSFRNADYVCRIGGDEFAVIMVHSDYELTELIRKKYEIMNEKMKDDEDGLPPLSFSAGVAFGEVGRDINTVFKGADEALYRAKEGGRGNICFHDM